MTARRLGKLLYTHGICFEKITHPMAFTSAEIAEAAHIPGRVLAKNVIVDADGQRLMIVLSASRHIDMDALREALCVRQIALLDEVDFRRDFPDCLPGAMPPFGELYGMEVVMDKLLAEESEIIFNAGTHHELIKMKMNDYVRLVTPMITDFSEVGVVSAA